jgi:hypothetical protein
MVLSLIFYFGDTAGQGTYVLRHGAVPDGSLLVVGRLDSLIRWFAADHALRRSLWHEEIN